MARFYSPEWVAAFNEALSGLELDTATSGALGASGGRFRVAYQVAGSPDGDLVVTLSATDGHLRMALVDGPADEETGAVAPDVTVSLSYEDAAAMSRGELDPATALGRGRVAVRGDLALLVAAQALLSAAAVHLAPLQAATTY